MGGFPKDEPVRRPAPVEERLGRVINMIPALVLSATPDGSVDFINQRWLEFTGLKSEELQGWGWRAAIHPDDVGRFAEELRAALAAGEPFENEARVRRSDGEYRWFRIHNVPLRDEQGKIIQWYGTGHDIEDYKRAQARIRQTETELQQAIDAIPAHVIVLEPNGHLVFANQQDLEYAGLTLQEVRSEEAIARIFHPEDVERVRYARRNLLSQEMPLEMEARIRGTDGRYRWFLIRLNPLKDASGRVVRWYGTRTDIEDRKQAEDRLRLVIDTTPALLHSARPDGYLDYFNKQWLDYLGLSLEDIRGWRWTHSIHPDDVEDMVGKWRSSLVTGEPAETEARVQRADGEYRWLLHRTVPLRDAAGNIVKWYGSSIDIEERKQAEDALRRSRTYLTEAQSLSHTGSFAYNPASRKTLYWSEELFRIFGLDPERGIPDYDETRRLVHPDDRDRVSEACLKGFREKAPFSQDYRLLLHDGTVKHLHVIWHPVLAKDGEVIEYVGTAADVTGRKQAELALQNAFDEIRVLKDQLHKENIVLREEVDKASMFEEIIGSSAALRRVLVDVAKVAPTDSTVLITGETGTGKELVARAIHRRSQRAARAFVPVNCAAIPPSLIATELFGHEKGAFTGAIQRQLGRFELADGGTIFLDEVGELPLETQITLLRVLQERTFERIGGRQPIAVNVRVLAASNRDLRAAIGAGTFRNDFFYRLSVFPIYVPPLRDRIDDIPVLVEYLIERYATKAGKKIRSVNKKTLDLFQEYDWPGNIRELQNVLERAVILCEGDTLAVDETWLQRQSPRPSVAQRGLGRLDVGQEKGMIETALAECRGRVSGPLGAAAKLGIPRSTLESRIRSLGINKHRFQSA